MLSSNEPFKHGVDINMHRATSTPNTKCHPEPIREKGKENIEMVSKTFSRRFYGSPNFRDLESREK